MLREWTRQTFTRLERVLTQPRAQGSYPVMQGSPFDHHSAHMSPPTTYDYAEIGSPNIPSSSKQRAAPYPSPQPQPYQEQQLTRIQRPDNHNFEFVTRRNHNKKALTPHDKKNICLYAEKYPSMRQEDIGKLQLRANYSDGTHRLTSVHFPC